MGRSYRFAAMLARAALVSLGCALAIAAAGQQANAAFLGLGAARSPIDVTECRPVASQNPLLPPSVEITFVNKSSRVMRRVDFVVIQDQQTIGHAIDIGSFTPDDVIAGRRSSIPREAFANGTPALRCVTDRVDFTDGERWHQ
ncbi:hypothetical protein EPN52_06125 [bacterium]|nr:MAG: hypothetical protein EPN52_06125 [bacterium]